MINEDILKRGAKQYYGTRSCDDGFTLHTELLPGDCVLSKPPEWWKQGSNIPLMVG